MFIEDGFAPLSQRAGKLGDVPGPGVRWAVAPRTEDSRRRLERSARERRIGRSQVQDCRVVQDG